MSIADDMINDIKKTANQFKDLGVSYSETAIGRYTFGGGLSPVLQAKAIDKSTIIPTLNKELFNITADLRTDFLNLFNNSDNELANVVTLQTQAFMDKYFPDANPGRDNAPMKFNEIQAYFYNVVNGDIKIPLQVELQWNAARDRELIEARRLEDEAYTNTASRGFSMPPLTTNYRVIAVHQTASKNISATNREIAIESAKLNLDLIKTSLDGAIKIKEMSLNKMESYFQNLIFKPREMALQEASAYIQSYQVFYASLSAYYNSQVELSKLSYEIDEANLKYGMQDRQIAIDYKKSDEQRKTNAYLESAKTVTNVAAAALSGLNALVVQANSTTS